MTDVLIALVVVLAAGLVALAATLLGYRVRRPSKVPVTGTRRIVLPFVANALSSRALDATLRLASAEQATLVPVFLARVSMDLPLDAPLPRQCGQAIPILEAIEQRAAKFGVPVDARIERGRDYRHALRNTIDTERFDRIVLAAAAHGSAGFAADDVAWLLEHAPGEIVVLRPSSGDAMPVTERKRPSLMRPPSSRRALPPARSTQSSALAR